MENKRNYYRLLHVQMDAPAGVIRSTYRTMMQTLRQHPDLGGDEWNASLLNEAREVLLNPKRRAQYDREMLQAGHAVGQMREQPVPQYSGAGGTPNQSFSQSDASTAVNASGQVNTTASEDVLQLPDTTAKCLFCHAPVLWKPQSATAYTTAFKCTRCDSPLNRVDNNYPALSNEQRRINRSYLESSAHLWPVWPLDSGFETIVCDWSILGCSIKLNAVLDTGQIVHLQSLGFDAVAAVVRRGELSSDMSIYGLKFLTVEIKLEAGAIYSSSV